MSPLLSIPWHLILMSNKKTEKDQCTTTFHKAAIDSQYTPSYKRSEIPCLSEHLCNRGPAGRRRADSYIVANRSGMLSTFFW